MSYWDNVRDAGLFGYGYDKKFKDVQAGEHFQRARTFAFGGSGAFRQEAANSLGIITNAQRNFASKSKLGKFMTAGIPLFGGMMMYDAAQNGEQVGSYVQNNIAPHIGMFYGARLGANLGAGLQKASGGSGWAGRAYGGVMGGGIGGLLAYGAATAATSFGTANNSIQTLKKKLYDPDINRDVLQTKNTITHRQAALAAISKSAMNNRGQLMGNEAQVLYGR